MPEATPVETTPVAQPQTPVIEAKVFDKDGKPVLGKDGKPFDPDRLQSAFDNLSASASANKDAAKRLQELEAAQATAETERMQKQGEFETLAKKYEGELNELKPNYESQKAELESLREIVQDAVDEQIKDWPESIKRTIPTADEASVPQRLKMVAALREAAEALMEKPARPGLHPIHGSAGRGNQAREAQPQPPKAIGFL